MSEDIYTEIVQSFGKTSQIIVCIEELSELTKELTKNLRGFGNTAQVSEEIADVEIMLRQLKIIFRNEEQVERFRTEKLERIRLRMYEGSGSVNRNCTNCQNGLHGERRYSACMGCALNPHPEDHWKQLEVLSDEQSDADWLSRG